MIVPRELPKLQGHLTELGMGRNSGKAGTTPPTTEESREECTQ
jgi:hypothetical protein